MVDKQQIIIGYFRQGKSTRQLARELHVLRNTVMKYINEYKSKVLVETRNKNMELPSKGVISPPTYNSPPRRKRVLSKNICAIINGRLAQNDIKQRNGKHKQQMQGTDIHEALLKQGHHDNSRYRQISISGIKSLREDSRFIFKALEGL